MTTNDRNIGSNSQHRPSDQIVANTDDRNPGLAKGIAAIHESGQTVFAAVGSLHMIGPMGLPQLLAKRGYRVERIEFTDRTTASRR